MGNFTDLDRSTTSGFEPVEAGNHAAVCVAMIDLGTQDDSYEGKSKLTRKVMLTFEFPDLLETFDAERGPEPRKLSKTFSWKFTEKSNLRKALTAWFGKFTDEDVKTFDETKVLGKAALINVTHEPKKDGSGNRAVITGIGPLPKSMAVPVPQSPLICYFIPKHDEEIFNTQPEWVQKVIALSPEYAAVIAKGDDPEEEKNENIPF